MKRLKGQLSFEALLVFALLLVLVAMIVQLQEKNNSLAENALKEFQALNEALKCSALIDLAYANNAFLEEKQLECIGFEGKAQSAERKAILLNDFTSTVQEGRALKIVIGGKGHYEK